MSTSVQQFLARVTPKAAEDLVTAFLRLPEDKRGWSPMAEARTALDQMAEVAILNGRTAELIQTKVFGKDVNSAMAEFQHQKIEVAKDWDALKKMLDENTAKVTEVIRNLPDSELGVSVEMPWGPMTVEQLIGYPSWNMGYHEGQINYLASMLGCLG